MELRTLRTQDTSDPGHFGTSEWWHCRWLWVTPNLYVIAMTLSVLEGRFPIASLRTVPAVFCCSAEVSTH